MVKLTNISCTLTTQLYDNYISFKPINSKLFLLTENQSNNFFAQGLRIASLELDVGATLETSGTVTAIHSGLK